MKSYKNGFTSGHLTLMLWLGVNPIASHAYEANKRAVAEPPALSLKEQIQKTPARLFGRWQGNSILKWQIANEGVHSI